MDTELRAPDPTLATIREFVGIAYPITANLTPVAHRLPEGPDRLLTGCCGIVGDAISSRYACWFSVPCRECFPDAPPPGYVNDCGCYTHAEGPCTPGLEWQVEHNPLPA